MAEATTDQGHLEARRTYWYQRQEPGGYLQAANPGYADILPDGELELLGVVVGRCRTYRR